MADFNSGEYKRSRTAYMAQSTFEYFVSLLVTDAFLAKLLTSIGISDALTGIISSFITIAFVIQLASIFLVRLRVSTKALVTTLDTTSIFFFMFLFLVPFLPVDKTAKTILVMLSLILAYSSKYLILSVCFKWANAYVEPTKRGSYSATKEMISLFSGMVFTAAVGYIIDRFEGLNNLNGAFLFIAISILILNIANFSCLLMIKRESPFSHRGDFEPLGNVIKNTLRNRNFRHVIVLEVIFKIATYFTAGFLGVYKTKDLGMTVLLVQIVNIGSNFARMIISKPFGRYSDKHSYVKGFKLGMILLSFAYLILMFTTRQTWWLIIVYTAIHSCATAGTNANSFNITYSYVNSKYITQAMAFKNSIGGLCGFLASLAGGRLLSVIQANGNMLFGIAVNGQQVLGAISCVLMIGAVVYTSIVIDKQKILIQ